MRRTYLVAAALALVACRKSERPSSAGADTLVVFTAASLAAPMRAVLDSFAATGVVVQQESGASLELARRVTALQRMPDVLALADMEVFPELVVPAAASWYAAFARNRMVVAYTRRSRHAEEITAQNWHTVLQRNDVAVGRSDPAAAPVGYRALIVYDLAERHYRDAGLAERLAAKTTPAHMRGNATELAALLEAGELDYIIDYESLARAHGFQYVTLPSAIDLGDPAHAAEYALGTTTVSRLRDTVTRRGAPILYALSIPRAAPHRASAERFVRFLTGSAGVRLLRSHAIDAFEAPVVSGDSAPELRKGAP